MAAGTNCYDCDTKKLEQVVLTQCDSVKSLTRYVGVMVAGEPGRNHKFSAGPKDKKKNVKFSNEIYSTKI